MPAVVTQHLQFLYM